MFDMINIFEVFLPQLLRYPNPTDPLNGEAAALLIREPKSYDAKVKGTPCCLVLTVHYSWLTETTLQNMYRSTPRKRQQTMLARRARTTTTYPP